MILRSGEVELNITRDSSLQDYPPVSWTGVSSLDIAVFVGAQQVLLPMGRVTETNNTRHPDTHGSDHSQMKIFLTLTLPRIGHTLV